MLMLPGCRTVQHPPLPTVAHADLQRFMGEWYVIASIPTRIEVGAHNAVWGMQFIWPIRADCRIAYLDPAYSQTVIARTERVPQRW
ncbi:MAG: lipocalin family protein [Gammaproteobacteria bacterium]|nr:lipocalin family protein [Gammaproteobacteria bacterium]